ncbi:hypothetical protein ACODM8_14370 [Vibrio ostreicida]|uniref:hypothetical protein n=1 Tax=Vibrio ostreicida TaxID=526588 RepID=UPI003B5C915E
MSEPREPIGFLPCKTCLNLKSVYQGQGKRARFLYVRCECGLDQRTGSCVQTVWQKHLNKEEATEALGAMKNVPSEQPAPNDKSSKAPLMVCCVLGVFGLLSLRG